MTAPFQVVDLDLDDRTFDELRASAHFEVMGPGREVAVLVAAEPRGVPLVRTTSSYEEPAQTFTQIHRRIADVVARAASVPSSFNNAMLEHYTNTYSKMKAHSDQALDLDPATNIAIVSCYADRRLPGTQRQLVVEAKRGGDSFVLPMRDRSAIVFSVETNRHFRHKIMLDRSANPAENAWLGLTLRTASRFVQYKPHAMLDGEVPLALATVQEAQRFYRLRSEENRQVAFRYPKLAVTVSPSDLLPPTIAT